MIKVIAFDMVGVLVREKDDVLNDLEDKIERKFGDLLSDQEFINESKTVINDEEKIIQMGKDICNKLYEVKDYNLLKKVKDKYPDIKICIATNHVSYIRNYINNNLDIKNVDKIFISAEINKAKPNKDFFEYIINSFGVKPQEMLFLDDSIRHIEGAKNLGINTIKVFKDLNILEEIDKIMSKSN